jgi:hypothetical protein
MDKAMETQARINELEGNVKIAARWIDAVERSTFHGTHAMDIGMLIGFLKEQHAKNKSELAKVLDEVKYPAPEFKKSEPDKVPA